MKYRALLSATAVISASFISATSATASTASSANPPTAADMQAVCDTLASGDGYQVILTQGSVQMGDPTFDTSTITDDESTRVANHSTLSSPYGTRSFYGSPGRHGGSVNLFATIGYPGITYAGSFVDQYADRVETDTYNFSCQVQAWVIVGSHQEPTRAVGVYVTYDDGQGADDPNRENCAQYTDNGQPWWGQQYLPSNAVRHCEFQGTPAGTQTVDDYDWRNQGDPVAESLTDGPYFVDNILYAAQVSELTTPATETDAPPYFAGDILVCNNPGKKGGTWTAQNGWTDMTKCTTLYFNSAPMISGANVFSSNSLPAN